MLTKRMRQKSTIATMFHCCDSTSAACSLIPSAMKTRVPYWMMKVQQVIWAPT